MNRIKQLNKDIAALEKRRIEMEGQSEWGSWQSYDSDQLEIQIIKQKKQILEKELEVLIKKHK